ncbi:MAG: transposase [Gammaproteobacteria bacterium]
MFFDERDYIQYRAWLREGAQRYGCTVHAYVLMTNHVHLLVTPQSREAISRTIQHVGRYYVSYINRLTSIGNTGVVEHCGKGGIKATWFRWRIIFWRAPVILNSTRCGQAWWKRRANTAGPAIKPMG